jgi:hypothetical protein
VQVLLPLHAGCVCVVAGWLVAACQTMHASHLSNMDKGVTPYPEASTHCCRHSWQTPSSSSALWRVPPMEATCSNS